MSSSSSHSPRASPSSSPRRSKRDRQDANDDPSETDDEYRLRVYGSTALVAESTTKGNTLDSSESSSRRKGSASAGNGSHTAMRRLSKSMSHEWNRRRRSSVREQLPETSSGWAVLMSVLSAAILRYELRLQKSLTRPPLVYGQVTEGPLQKIYECMSKSEESILRRNIQPSLFVGTRGVMASTAAFLLKGPSKSASHLQFREIMTMAGDGAKVAIDWELPWDDGRKSAEALQHEILHGTIGQPVVLILHGLNNNSEFGYVRSMMRTCVERGWVAAGMNLRGCGGLGLSTPRGYNGSYTGDIRSVVHSISGRVGEESCIFLVGNSLGANLVTKYLGEEGLSGSLPRTVAGGVALGNPLLMNSSHISLLWSPLMALGAKKSLLENWSSLHQSNDPNIARGMKKALLAPTLASFDNALAPIFARNDPLYPFSFRVGFKDGNAYWTDAGSYRLIRFVPVPLLTLAASDDFIVFRPARGRLSFSLGNPNVMWVETKCGGHLGWQETPPDKGNWEKGASWADAAAADFIDAALSARRQKGKRSTESEFHESFGNSLEASDALSFEHPSLKARL